MFLKIILWNYLGRGFFLIFYLFLVAKFEIKILFLKKNWWRKKFLGEIYLAQLQLQSPGGTILSPKHQSTNRVWQCSVGSNNNEESPSDIQALSRGRLGASASYRAFDNIFFDLFVFGKFWTLTYANHNIL